MEKVVERANLRAALKRVKQNKGCPVIDAMAVGELPSYGFRPGRRAYQAIGPRAGVLAGRTQRVVVDVDLAKFFDRANLDIVREGSDCHLPPPPSRCEPKLSG